MIPMAAPGLMSPSCGQFGVTRSGLAIVLVHVGYPPRAPADPGAGYVPGALLCGGAAVAGAAWFGATGVAASCAGVSAPGGSVFDSPLNRKRCTRLPGATSTATRSPFEFAARWWMP